MLINKSSDVKVICSVNLTGRKFIVSMKQGQPLWDFIEIEGIEDLSAVKWKLLNILNMDPIKHKKAVHKLRDYLGV